jgi:hypothetical protein
VAIEPGDICGSCLCGAIRYRTPPPKLTPTLCHCASCRKAAGAHAVGLFTVDRERAVIEGQVTEFQSSAKVVRGAYILALRIGQPTCPSRLPHWMIQAVSHPSIILGWLTPRAGTYLLTGYPSSSTIGHRNASGSDLREVISRARGRVNVDRIPPRRDDPMHYATGRP